MPITVQTSTDVSQLYVSLFGRAPDGEGYGFWASRLEAGQSQAQVADAMFATAPARAYYPSGMTHGQIVSSFYAHVLGRAPDAEGLAFWTARLDAPGATPGSVIAQMIANVASYQGSDPAGMESAALFDNRVAVARYFGEHGSSVEAARHALDGVTSDPATVDAATHGATASGAPYEVHDRLVGTLDMAGLGARDLKLDGGAGAATVKGLAGGAVIESNASHTGTLTLSLADASGASDSLGLKLDAAGLADFRTVNAAGVETLNIESTTSASNPSSVSNTLVLSPDAHTTLNISGNVMLDLAPAWTEALFSVKSVNAAGFDAGLEIYLYGNTNDLAVSVGNGNDTVVAGFGSDTIATGGGNDVIFAGRASDTVDAGAGNDWIRGGPARDVMTGGTGSDTFAYSLAYESQGSEVDLIKDFAVGAGGDVLDFHELTKGAGSYAGAANGFAAAQAKLTAGSVHAVFDSATGTVWLDLDANGALDGVNDMAIQLTGVAGGLVEANFVF